MGIRLRLALVTIIFFFGCGGDLNSQDLSPENVLGVQAGERPFRYDEIESYFSFLAENSSRALFFKSGYTHEGRELIYLVVGSEQNIARYGDIRSQLARLADPRQTNNSTAEEIVRSTPAAAVMLFSIHGDELSGSDAAVKLAWELVGSDNEKARLIRDNIITVIYPSQNPDGRERWLSMVEQWQGKIHSTDGQSLSHAGTWPWGRTNHYHFDLNRDWIIGSQPETEARLEVLNSWNPHLVIDAQ